MFFDFVAFCCAINKLKQTKLAQQFTFDRNRCHEIELKRQWILKNVSWVFDIRYAWVLYLMPSNAIIQRNLNFQCNNLSVWIARLDLVHRNVHFRTQIHQKRRSFELDRIRLIFADFCKSVSIHLFYWKINIIVLGIWMNFDLLRSSSQCWYLLVSNSVELNILVSDIFPRFSIEISTNGVEFVIRCLFFHKNVSKCINRKW